MNIVKYFPVLLFLLSLQSCAYYFGNARIKRSVPTEIFTDFRTAENRDLNENEDWAKHPIVQDFASVKMDADWKTKGKTNSPRILLAKLALGQELDSVNAYLCRLQPWGRSGTNWLLNPNGDYDFSEIILVNILYLFGNDSSRLYPNTVVHLLDVLLIEKSPKPENKTPGSLGILKETENHILMKESVRYLRRYWIYSYGKETENQQKELERLEKFLFTQLHEMLEYGFWEYNSIPYLGYTVVPLLTLEAHAPSERIRMEARKILDQMNYEYILGTIDFKRVVPFRRQLHRHGWSDLSADPHTALMRTWYYQKKGIPVSKELSPHSTHQSLMALLLPYRLPDSLLNMIDNRNSLSSLHLIGHGWHSSPEIHWKGPDWLLTGGGVQRGKISQLVPRPIVLILNDSTQATDIKQCFHIQGPPKIKKKNNTGIYKGFAVAKSPVTVPVGYLPELIVGNWQFFSVPGRTEDKVLVYNTDKMGILLFVKDWQGTIKSLSDFILQHNADQKLLKHKISLPDKSIIEFNLNSNKNRWVIKSLNGEKMDRNFDRWKRVIIK